LEALNSIKKLQKTQSNH